MVNLTRNGNFICISNIKMLASLVTVVNDLSRDLDEQMDVPWHHFCVPDPAKGLERFVF